jgi:hypothetical protein
MNTNLQPTDTDSAPPIAFIVISTFATALLWLYALLSAMPQP